MHHPTDRMTQTTACINWSDKDWNAEVHNKLSSQILQTSRQVRKGKKVTGQEEEMWMLYHCTLRAEEGRKEMFYLTTHSPYFIYSYMVLGLGLKRPLR